MSKLTAEVNLCSCNMCGSILIDENPQVGAKKHNVDLSKVKEMVKSCDGGECFWACPICKTDDYLTDTVIEGLTIRFQ